MLYKLETKTKFCKISNYFIEKSEKKRSSTYGILRKLSN
jgi:hypothetical protein